MPGLTNQSPFQYMADDTSGEPVALSVDGNGSLWVRMEEQFNMIVRELKKVVLQLSFLTDENVASEDVEV